MLSCSLLKGFVKNRFNHSNSDPWRGWGSPTKCHRSMLRKMRVTVAADRIRDPWLLGQDPTVAIINVTSGQDLSDKFARDYAIALVSGDIFDAPVDVARSAPGARHDQGRVSFGDVDRRHAHRAAGPI